MVAQLLLKGLAMREDEVAGLIGRSLVVLVMRMPSNSGIAKGSQDALTRLAFRVAERFDELDLK